MEEEKPQCIAGALGKGAPSLPYQSYNLREQDVSFPVLGTVATTILKTHAKKISTQDVPGKNN